MELTATKADGTQVKWQATKITPPARARGQRLSQKGFYRNKEVFERLTTPKNRVREERSRTCAMPFRHWTQVSRL